MRGGRGGAVQYAIAGAGVCDGMFRALGPPHVHSEPSREAPLPANDLRE